MDGVFFFKKGQITTFWFSNNFGLHTCSTLGMYQNNLFWGLLQKIIWRIYPSSTRRKKLMNGYLCLSPWTTDVTAHSAHMLTDTEQRNSTTPTQQNLCFTLPQQCRLDIGDNQGSWYTYNNCTSPKILK